MLQIQMMTTNHNRQTGVALISVMLIVALAAIVATEMTTRLQLQMQRTNNIQLNQQAYWYAMGAESFAKRVISMAQKDEPDKTHLMQLWAQPYDNFPVEYGEISGGIRDLQACLNLNALREPNTNQGNNAANNENGTQSNNSQSSNAQNNGGQNNNAQNQKSKNTKNGQGDDKPAIRLAFEQLIVALEVEGIGEFEAEYMADALTDWLDSDDSIVSAGGAEDNDYASKEFPYFSANHYLSSVNELRVIEHFNPVVIQALKPYVCVLPENNLHQININTIDAEQPQLLQALLSISKPEALDIISARDPEGYSDINDFFSLPEVSKLKISNEQKQQFVVDSEYFTLEATASFNGSYFTLNSIMKVEQNNQVNVVSRTLGRL